MRLRWSRTIVQMTCLAHQLVFPDGGRCLRPHQRTFLIIQKDKGLCFQSLGRHMTSPPPEALAIPHSTSSTRRAFHDCPAQSLAACERKFPISNFACGKICTFLRGPFVRGSNGSNWSAEVIKCSVSSTLRRHAWDVL